MNQITKVCLHFYTCCRLDIAGLNFEYSLKTVNPRTLECVFVCLTFLLKDNQTIENFYKYSSKRVFCQLSKLLKSRVFLIKYTF